MASLDKPNKSNSRVLIDCNDKPQRPLKTYAEYLEENKAKEKLFKKRFNLII